MAMPDTELTDDELLIGLTEECAEVIQAATKCLRFGWHRLYPTYGVNHEVLAQEIGDLLAIIEALPLDTGIIGAYKKLKIAKMQQAKQDFGR
jgi:NTP pyrophosphatase (non-canonical NTP hydrolase)